MSDWTSGEGWGAQYHWQESQVEHQKRETAYR
jgi:hypothetical protein